MSIEIGEVIIQCNRCTARLVHDPSFLPVSSGIPTWSAQEAMQFATKAGWLIEYDPKIKDIWTDCPACQIDQGT